MPERRHPSTSCGIPRAIHGGGAVMNIPIVNNFGFDGDGSAAAQQAKLNYILQVGTLSSALEHAVPEQMFVTAEHPGEAISAVKALSKASAAGQRIYHLTPANRASTLPAIHHNSLVMNEIKNALNSGKEVITHTDAVSVPGWSGAGYIIYDPVTGDGAYKIGGGENGSFAAIVTIIVLIAIIAYFGWFLLFAAAAANVTTSAFALILGGAILNFFDFISDLQRVNSKDQLNQQIAASWLKLILSAIPIFNIAKDIPFMTFVVGSILGIFESNA